MVRRHHANRLSPEYRCKNAQGKENAGEVLPSKANIAISECGQTWKNNNALITDARTSAHMAKIRTKGTKPELEVRRLLKNLGLSYRISNSDLPGTPDIANRKMKWVIFVHGCFWHGHSGCPKAKLPHRNHDHWNNKIQMNRNRDAITENKLRSSGFNVAIIWECEIKSFQDNPLRLLPLLGLDLKDI